MSLDPLIGAIGAGNAAVLMPSIVTHSSFTVLNELIPKYLDKNAIKVVGCETRVTEEMLNLQWDKIFFTGSPRIAKFVMQKAAEHLTPVTLELGGKCPTIVDSSTDMEVAARRIAAGKWGVNCGQSLIAPDYVIVEKGFAPVLLKALKNALRSFFGSHPSPENPDLMRLVNEEHFRRVKAFLEDPSVSRTIKHGGGYDIEKRYIEPTILLDPPRNAKIMREEILGPILPIITVERIDEAIDFINTKEKPLALYLFTENDDLKNEVINKTSAGTMLINDTVIHVTMQELPFGGVGKSGMGAHHGKFSFEAFSHMKPVMVRSMAGDVDARYPPYTPEKRNILRRIARFQYLPLLLVWLGLTK
ncbi:hypothetical protein KP509_03G020600 [Ceratopteris richardii]|nr:hypothetical protein KP509_03G020600 [Ceratopteris richardii]